MRTQIAEDHIHFSAPTITPHSEIFSSNGNQLIITSELDSEHASTDQFNKLFLQIKNELGNIYQSLEFQNFNLIDTGNGGYKGDYEGRHPVFESEFSKFSLEFVSDTVNPRLRSLLTQSCKESFFKNFRTEYSVFQNDRGKLCCTCQVDFVLSSIGKKAGVNVVSAVVKQAFSKLWRRLLAPETFNFEEQLRANFTGDKNTLATFQDYQVDAATLFNLLNSNLLSLHPRIQSDKKENQITLRLLILGNEEPITFTVRTEGNAVLLRAKNADGDFSNTTRATWMLLKEITMKFSIDAAENGARCQSDFAIKFGKIGGAASTFANYCSGGKVNAAICEGLKTLMITMMRRLSQLADASCTVSRVEEATRAMTM